MASEYERELERTRQQIETIKQNCALEKKRLREIEKARQEKKKKL